MNPGDLIRFRYDPYGLNRVMIGMWFSKRLTKWSGEHFFHKVFVPGEGDDGGGGAKILTETGEIRDVHESFHKVEVISGHFNYQS